jgi:TP901 family phage tail tape measure protein
VTVIGTAEIEVLANTSNFASGLKKGLLGVTAGALAGIGGTVAASIKQFADFESGINEVFTLLGADAPQETLTAIEDQVKNLSQSFGLDLNDAIQGTYDSISAGVDPAATESFNAFTETAAKFATAGATDFGTSVDLLTTATNAFGLNAADAESTADVLFATIQGGKTTADELAASLFQVAPVAASAGVSLEEVSAGLATLTAQGVPTAGAATQLKAAFSELSKTGSVADRAFRDIAGKGFVQFLDQGGNVQDAFNLLRESADQSGIQVTDLFGSIEAGAAVLGTTGDQADRFAGNLENIEGAAGATQGAFDRMDEGIGAAFARIKQTFAVALVDIGAAFAPFVSSVANVLADRLPGIIDGLVGAFTGMANTVGPIISDLAAGVGAFFDSFADPDVTSTGLVGLFEALGATARRVFDGLNLGGIFDNLFGDVNVGGGFTDIIDQIIDTLIRLQPQIESVASSIGTILAANAGVTRDVFTELAPVFLELATTVLPALADVLKIVAEALGFIVENTPAPVLAATVGGFIALQKALAALKIAQAAGGLVTYLTQLRLVTRATQLWAGAQRAFQAVAAAGSFIRALSSNLITYVRSVNLAAIATRLWAAAQRVLNLSFLASPIGVAIAAVAALTGAFILAYQNSETFREGVHAVLDALSPLVDIAKLVGEAFGALFSGDFSGAFDKFREAGSGLLDFFAGLGGQIGDLLVSGFRAVLEAVNLGDVIDIDAVFGQISAGVDQILFAFDTIKGVISSLFEGDFSGAFDGLLSAAGDLVLGFGIIGKAAINAVIDAVQAGLDAVGLGFIADALEPIQTIFNSLIDAALEFAGAIVTASGPAFTGFQQVKGAIEGVFLAVKRIIDGDFSGAFNGLLTAGADLILGFGLIGRDLFNTLVDGLQAGLDAAGLGFIADALEPIQTAVSAALDGVIAFAGAFVLGGDEIFNSGFVGLLERIGLIARDVADVILDLGGIIVDVFQGDFSSAIDGLGGLLDGLVDLFANVGRLAGEALIFAVTSVFDAIGLGGVGDRIEAVLRGIGDMVQVVAPAVFGVLGTIAEVAFNLLVGVVRIGVATVGSLIDAARAVWDTGILQGVFTGLATAIDVAWTLISGFVRIGIVTVGSLIDAAQAVWDTGILQGAFDLLVDAIGFAFRQMTIAIRVGVATIGALIDAAQAIWDTGILQGAFRTLLAVIGFVWGQIEGVIQTAVDAVGLVIDAAQAIWDTGFLQAGFRALADFVAEVWSDIEQVIQLAVDAVGAVLGAVETVWNLPVVQAVFDTISNVWDTAWAAASAVVETVVDLVGGYFEAVQEVWNVAQVEGIFGAIAEAWDQAWALASDVIDAAIGLITDALGFFGIGGGDSEVAGIGSVFDPISGLWDAAFGLASGILDGFIGGLEATLSFFDTIGDLVGAAFDAVGGLWDATFGALIDFVVGWIADLLSTFVDNFVEGLQVWVDFGQDIFDTVTGFLGDVLGAVGGWIEDFIRLEVRGFERIVEKVVEWAKDFYDAVVKPLVDLAVAIGEWIGDRVTDIADFGADLVRIGQEKFTELKDRVTGIVEDLASALSAVWTRIRDAVAERAAALRDAVVERFTALKDRAQTIIETFKTTISTTFTTLKVAVEERVSQLRDGIVSRFEALRDKVSSAADKAKELVVNAFQALKDFISGLLDGVGLGSIDVSGILGPLQSIVDKVTDALGAIKDLGKKIPGVSSAASAAGSVISRLNPFSQGGLATAPGIVSEDGRPELVLPLTRPGRMKSLLGQFSPTIAQAVGGFDELVNVLSSGRDGARAVLPPGPFPDSAAGSPRTLSTAGTGRTRSIVDNSVRNYNFYGPEASEVARQVALDRRTDVLEGLRVRG